MIEFNCPHCQKRLRVKPEAAGRVGKCNGCAQKVVVPSPSSAEQETFDTLAMYNQSMDLGSALDEALAGSQPNYLDANVPEGATPLYEPFHAESKPRTSENKPATKPLIRCEPYTKRAYIHTICGGSTTVEDGSLAHLLNPFRFVNMTICASCGRADMAANFKWKDTGEYVHEYRSRVFADVPIFHKLMMFLVIPLLVGIAVYFALPLLPPPGKNGGDPKILALLAIPLGYLIGVLAMIMTPLSNLVALMCGLRFNTYK